MTSERRQPGRTRKQLRGGVWRPPERSAPLRSGCSCSSAPLRAPRCAALCCAMLALLALLAAALLALLGVRRAAAPGAWVPLKRWALGGLLLLHGAWRQRASCGGAAEPRRPRLLRPDPHVSGPMCPSTTRFPGTSSLSLVPRLPGTSFSGTPSPRTYLPGAPFPSILISLASHLYGTLLTGTPSPQHSVQMHAISRTPIPWDAHCIPMQCHPQDPYPLGSPLYPNACHLQDPSPGLLVPLARSPGLLCVGLTSLKGTHPSASPAPQHLASPLHQEPPSLASRCWASLTTQSWDLHPFSPLSTSLG